MERVEGGTKESKKKKEKKEKEVRQVPRPSGDAGARLEVLRKAAAWRGQQDSAQRGGMALI